MAAGIQRKINQFSDALYINIIGMCGPDWLQLFPNTNLQLQEK